MVVYVYVGVGGAAALTSRLAYKAVPETIEDYFAAGGWQVSLMEWVYLLHLGTVIPFTLMVSQ